MSALPADMSPVYGGMCLQAQVFMSCALRARGAQLPGMLSGIQQASVTGVNTGWIFQLVLAAFYLN